MTALFIILGVILLISLFLLVPVTAALGYNDTFSLKIYVFGVRVFTNKKKGKKQEEKQNAETKDTKPPKKQSKIKKLIKERGFSDVLSSVTKLIKSVLSDLRFLLKKTTVSDVILNLNVAADNAALTAIEYGAVCAVVYPFLNFLDGITNFYPKSINVLSDFDSEEISFDFSMNVKASPAVLLIAAVKIYNAYKKFTEGENNER